MLLVVADDLGMGPETTRGILEMAAAGRVTSAVLLVNSPFAEQAVREWRRCPAPLEVGWHPCLTLDRPVLPGDRVPSLVDSGGQFWPLGSFLLRLRLGRIRLEEVAAELRAQFDRFVELTGAPPSLVNSHQHVCIFPPICTVLKDLLATLRPLPYVRRVREPWSLIRAVPGARLKRLFLSHSARRCVRELESEGFPGNDCLAGIADPRCVSDPDYLRRWLRHAPGRVVELMVHPGRHDTTLLGRDCREGDGRLERREWELRHLSAPDFLDAVEREGFALTGTRQLIGAVQRGNVHAC
jgi:predicted glycoside hydrolase/deacetylase ChbG (UPF0249 family)